MSCMRFGKKALTSKVLGKPVRSSQQLPACKYVLSGFRADGWAANNAVLPTGNPLSHHTATFLTPTFFQWASKKPHGYITRFREPWQRHTKASMHPLRATTQRWERKKFTWRCYVGSCDLCGEWGRCHISGAGLSIAAHTISGFMYLTTGKQSGTCWQPSGQHMDAWEDLIVELLILSSLNAALSELRDSGTETFLEGCIMKLNTHVIRYIKIASI